MKAKQSEMEKKALRKRIYQYRVQYLFLVPAFVAVIIFAYIPMAGVVTVSYTHLTLPTKRIV